MGKRDERPEVALVGLPDCVDVSLTNFTRCDQVLARTPRQFGATAGGDHDVSDQPGMPPVAVGPRMDQDQPVMQPDGGLGQGIGRMIEPCLGIIEGIADTLGEPVNLPTEIFLVGAVFPGPFPDLVEHPAVQLPGESVG